VGGRNTNATPAQSPAYNKQFGKSGTNICAKLQHSTSATSHIRKTLYAILGRHQQTINKTRKIRRNI